MKNIIITLGCLLAIAGIVYGYAYMFGSRGLNVLEYKIFSDKLTDDYYGFKIVHISDIHYGRTVREKELRHLVDKINELKPNAVVLTGDLIDRDRTIEPNDVDTIIDILSDIKVDAGKYAITGNHDAFHTNWKTIIEGSGFINLNESYESIYYNSEDYLLIAGMSQNSHGKLSVSDKMNPLYDYLNGLGVVLEDGTTKKAPLYNILLLHEPDVIDEIESDRFDLILGGHSHNGQINIPFIKKLYLPRLGRKYYDHHYRKNNTEIYISSGVGASSFDIRLFEKPSINLYRFTNKD